MKARKIIGGIAAITGLFVAVCYKDGAPFELVIRMSGIALFAIGAAFGGFFDFQKSEQ